MSLLNTNNCRVYINDKLCSNCKTISIKAEAGDALFYCAVEVSDMHDPELTYTGEGYIERIINNEFYLILSDNTPNQDFFKANYL